MATHWEKIIFGLLGAVTAIVIGLAVFHDYKKPNERTPASQQEQFEFQPYEYFID